MRARFEKLRRHAGQQRYWLSRKRFNLAHPGRRAGKSEIAKRRLVERATEGTKYRSPRFCAAAPTFTQAKAIYWEDLKRMVHPLAMRGPPIETTLTIKLWHGGELFVMGMDRPERIEGPPLDHIVLDEYANMKAKVWGEHVRPALADRDGTADMIGVPEGRNHYFKLSEIAKAQALEPDGGWGYHHWHSSEILAAGEIEAARRDLDDLTFEQEFGGEFVMFGGRAYYGFGEYSRAKLRERYDPNRTLIVCLDFNVSPGVAAIAQEMRLPVGPVTDPTHCGPGDTVGLEPYGTAVIGEVHIPDNSTTPAVCRKILADWKGHRGQVEVYGDATGGSRGSAQTEGSDWDLVRNILAKGDEEETGFGPRAKFMVKTANPTERARLNAMNSRFRSSAGLIRMMVDPIHAPNVILDLEGVVTLAGARDGEIDKKKYPKLSHITDGLGYYVEFRFPVASREWSEVRVHW